MVIARGWSLNHPECCAARSKILKAEADEYWKRIQDTSGTLRTKLYKALHHLGIKPVEELRLPRIFDSIEMLSELTGPIEFTELEAMEKALKDLRGTDAQLNIHYHIGADGLITPKPAPKTKEVTQSV